MPQLEQLWNETKDKGFHIFHIESQGASEEDLRKFCEEKNLTFPQVMSSGSDFNNYPGGNGLPYAFVIGVDGKVAWQGRSGYKGVIHEELKKVRYPGLGKLEVADAVHKAAAQFATKRYGKAIDMATKLLEHDDAATVSDAQLVIARANLKGTQLVDQAKRDESNREYASAMATYKFLEKAYKGHDRGKMAAEKRSALKKDKSVQKEIKAAAALAQVLVATERKNPPVQAQALAGFVKRFDGTKAAEKAKKKLSKLGY